ALQRRPLSADKVFRANLSVGRCSPCRRTRCTGALSSALGAFGSEAAENQADFGNQGRLDGGRELEQCATLLRDRINFECGSPYRVVDAIDYAANDSVGLIATS